MPKAGSAGPESTAPDTQIDDLVQAGLVALAAYDPFTQEQIDHIVKKASVAALSRHGELAQLAVEETGRGVFEDKAVKNIFACEHVTHAMGATEDGGVISRDDLDGLVEIAEPVGVIAGITPVTNPTSTVIFKACWP
jgi:acetaldehyde dehydrogenase/alcohol dehydrogenase